jgi:hypothetical protein
LGNNFYNTNKKETSKSRKRLNFNNIWKIFQFFRWRASIKLIRWDVRMLIVQKKWSFTRTRWCGGGAWDILRWDVSMLIVQKMWSFTRTWWCGGGAWDIQIREKDQRKERVSRTRKPKLPPGTSQGNLPLATTHGKFPLLTCGKVGLDYNQSLYWSLQNSKKLF